MWCSEYFVAMGEDRMSKGHPACSAKSSGKLSSWRSEFQHVYKNTREPGVQFWVFLCSQRRLIRRKDSRFVCVESSHGPAASGWTEGHRMKSSWVLLSLGSLLCAAWSSTGSLGYSFQLRLWVWVWCPGCGLQRLKLPEKKLWHADLLSRSKSFNIFYKLRKVHFYIYKIGTC